MFPLVSGALYFMNPFGEGSGWELHVRYIKFCSAANDKFMVGLFYNINCHIKCLK